MADKLVGFVDLVSSKLLGALTEFINVVLSSK